MSTSTTSSSGHSIQPMVPRDLTAAAPADARRHLRTTSLRNASRFIYVQANIALRVLEHPRRRSCSSGAQGGEYWASSACQGHLLLGSASSLCQMEGGNSTVRCQQLHSLQNKKPLSGINALSNYLPHERKSAFSQGDSRTLGLCTLSFPFQS